MSRGHFSGQFGFILAAAGSAVGLSNIWRFPYLAGQNGGAVFLIIYITCIFLFCFPVMVGEIAIGRAAGKDAVGSYTSLGNKRWGLLGLFGVISGIFILSYYNVVAGWAFGYFVEIVFGDLLRQNDFGAYFGGFVNSIGKTLLYSLVFIVVTALCIVRGIQKGLERANKILMPGLFIVLLGLMIYSLTLPGAVAGVRFYLIPDFSEIKAQTIFDALKLSFFTLSLGVGGLITYGSYLKKENNIVQSSFVVVIADLTVAFLAGLMVFPLVFSAGQSPTEGPPLVFMVMPTIFSDMPLVVGKIVGGAFFMLLCFAAITSCFSLLELPTTYFVDQKKFKRSTVVWLLSLIVFLLGLPSLMSFGAVPFLNKLSFYKDREFLTLIADITDITLTTGGCLMSIFIVTKWKLGNFNREVAIGNPSYLGSLTQSFVNFSLRYLCAPLLGLLTILIIADKLFGLF
jgi:neurotransmitter:Na+ symporter, NSS family